LAWYVAAAQEQAVTTSQAFREPLSVKYEGGHLAVRTQSASLQAALEEVARQTQVKITVAQEVEDTESP
jgi:hypothetical protein